MPGATPLHIETLQRDAAALFSFIDSVCLHCPERVEAPAYLSPSVTFFMYIRRLGDATKAFLNAFPGGAPSDQKLYQFYRQKLETIRSGWFEFHQFIKPAVDADTLNVPYALVESLTTRLNGITEFKKTKFVVFHFHEVNYLQVRSSEIKKTANRLASLIPESPDFPADLGMIGIPYSQSSSLYLNCLIAHEIGHYVFQNLELKQKLLPHVGQSLKQSLGAQFASAGTEYLDWSRDRLLSWSEELFCDLFALWLVGPCYALAYVELFGLTTMLDPGAAAGYVLTPESYTFSRSHPADLFRLKQHVELLKGNLGWWKDVDIIKSHYLEVLRIASVTDDSVFDFPTGELDQGHANGTLRAFFGLVTNVANLLGGIVVTLDSGVAGYQKFREHIEEYLQNAVVPSTVFLDDDQWYPDTVALLNASMKFYLESLESLMNRIKDQKTSLAGHRSKWIRRVEALTAKAIEDHALLVGENGALRDGSAFKRANLRSPE
jgi:hypothetical protein